MQKKSFIFKIELLNTLFILLLGTILHFTFEWSNNNLLVGTFSSVNESTWEHLKLLFFPILITGLIGHFILKIHTNYLCIKTNGILIAFLFTIVFFYTYTGILGTNFAFLNIGIYIVAVLLSQYYTYKKVQSNKSCNNSISSIVLIILFLCFIIFTFFPPHIGLFQDPITCMFGI